MFVIPLKWLPWILAFSGVISLFSGEAFGIVPGIIGAVWLYFIFKNKNSSSTASQSSSNSSSAYSATAQTSTVASNSVSSSDTDVCPNCKAQIGNGMSFCNNCGTRVK